MSFLSSSTKSKVYLSVTPGIGLEMIQLDVSSGKVANYSVRELAYDEQQKRIVDKDAFVKAVTEMYEETGISPKSQVVVNMPVVCCGITTKFDLMLSNVDAITSAIANDLQMNEYLFRNQEPVVSWLDMPSVSNSTDGKEVRTIIYTAIQKSVVEMLQAALLEVGSTLVGVQDSLTSTFRALDYMDVTSTQMQPNTTWNLLMINATGYTLVSMSGKNVVTYEEEPVAFKLYEGDQIYDAIVESAKITLMSYPANYLYVISNTDQVSAAVLIAKLKPTCPVDYIENNAFKKQDSLIPVSLNILQSYQTKISLQAIGCALEEVSNFPLKFNLMSVELTPELSCIIPIGEKEVVVTQKQAFIFVGVIAAVLLGILTILTYIVIPGMERSQSAKTEEYNTQITEMETEIASYSKTPDPAASFDYRQQVESGVRNNRAKLMNYSAAGEAIPNNVWLTYFMTQGDGKVDIRGGSTDVSAVYTYFKNMRDSLIGSNLKLQKLEMDTESVDAAVADAGSNYSFEITNMSESQLKALTTPEGAVDAMGGQSENGEQGAAAPEAPGEQKDGDNGLLSNKPIQ